MGKKIGSLQILPKSKPLHWENSIFNDGKCQTQEKNIHLVMGRLAYASVANLAILPMQDVLGLDENARMNIPGSPTENWLWRLLPDQITTDVEVRLKEWVELYNR